MTNFGSLEYVKFKYFYTNPKYSLFYLNVFNPLSGLRGLHSLKFPSCEIYSINGT